MRARNFRASFRLTSSRTGKIYEKNACQRGDGIYENSRFVPVDSVSSSRPHSWTPFFLPTRFFLLISRPSISLARNLVCRYIQKVHRLVMHFLRYIKAYILWHVRITRDGNSKLRLKDRRRHANNVKGASEWLMRLRGRLLQR